VAGFLIGIVASLIGVGGGVFYVPITYYLLKIQSVPDGAAFKFALGTSLFTMFFTSLTAAAGHVRNGNYIKGGVPWLAVFCVAGSQIGSWLAVSAQVHVLQKIFSVMLFVVAMQMMRDKKKGGDDGESGRHGNSRSNAALFALAGFVTGFIGALLGVGGGIILIPALYIVMGRDFREVVGTSSIIIVVNSLSGFAHYMLAKPETPLPFTVGLVHLLIAAALAPGSMLGAKFGVNLLMKMNPKPVKMIFAFFVILMGLEMSGVFEIIKRIIR